MNTNHNEPAFPGEETVTMGGIPSGHEYHYGLTKREYFSAKALQGLLANPNNDGKRSEYAKDAVNQADALLAELAKTEGSK